MNIEKKLAEIEQHFNEITDEELNQKLIKNGYGIIQPASQSGYHMVEPVKEIKKKS